MLQPTLTRRIESAIQTLDEASTLLGVLDTFDSIYAQADKYILAIADGGRSGSIPENGNALHSQMASLPGITKDINARKLFGIIENLEVGLSNALANGLDETKHIMQSIGILDEFANVYNNYLVHPTGTNAWPVLTVAHKLKLTLNNLRDFLQHIRSNSETRLPPGVGEAEFSMVMANITDLADFANKLKLLSDLYAELCYVLNVSVASHPLRIGKIESGSLWVRVVGDTRVIATMLSFVEASVRYFHRNYTTEGKVAAIPKKIEALDSILQYSNRLEAAGADVTEIKDILAKSTVVIASSLNDLVSNQPIVELNGQVLSIDHEIQRRLVEQARAPRIPLAMKSLFTEKDSSETKPDTPDAK